MEPETLRGRTYLREAGEGRGSRGRLYPDRARGLSGPQETRTRCTKQLSPVHHGPPRRDSEATEGWTGSMDGQTAQGRLRWSMSVWDVVAKRHNRILPVQSRSGQPSVLKRHSLLCGALQGSGPFQLSATRGPPA